MKREESEKMILKHKRNISKLSKFILSVMDNLDIIIMTRAAQMMDRTEPPICPRSCPKNFRANIFGAIPARSYVARDQDRVGHVIQAT